MTARTYQVDPNGEIFSKRVKAIASSVAIAALGLFSSLDAFATPLPVSAVMASDGATPGPVVLTFTAPNQTASCSNVSYVITRSGIDIDTITNIPPIGGNQTYNDSIAKPGTVYTLSLIHI